MQRNEPVIHSDPEIMGGTPVFVGTRVPLATLLDLGALPARVCGSGSVEDPFHLVLDFGGGVLEGIQDLYRFQTTASVTIV